MNNGIIKCCSFNNNFGRYATLFYSNETASFIYNNAVNNSQYTLIYRSDGNYLQMIQSNFSHTKSQHQGSISSNKVYFHEQKFINNYKCGNDTGGATITVYLGISFTSFSNYIDIESNGVNFLVVGYGSESNFKSCFFQIKGYNYNSFLGFWPNKNNETVYFEDCTIISDIQHNLQYLRTKNVILTTSKSDYTFVNIPYLETDIIDFDETIFHHCYQTRFNYFIIFIVLTNDGPN